jgi:hypothetical protein
MFRHAITVCTAATALLLTVGTTVPSKAADRVGALLNAYVPSNRGPIRVYGNVMTWSGATFGRLWICPQGSTQSFLCSPSVLTFSSPNRAHLESTGRYNNRAARLIMDITTNPSSITFRIVQDNVTVMSTPVGVSRQALLSGSVILFAP